MKSDLDSAIRAQSGELRSWCGLLRDHSRELRFRARECRNRLSRAAKAIDTAAAEMAQTHETDGVAHLARLTRAETDLQSAIAECSAALADVRRELGWRDPAHHQIVH